MSDILNKIFNRKVEYKSHIIYIDCLNNYGYNCLIFNQKGLIMQSYTNLDNYCQARQVAHAFIDALHYETNTSE